MAFLNKSADSKAGKAGRITDNLAGLPLQAKLRMGRPNDTYEQEADRTADRVLNAPYPSTSEAVQRQTEEEETVQSSPLAGQISRYMQKQEQEDREPVQSQSVEEEEPVQTQTEDEEPVQTQSAEEEEPVQAQTEDEEPVQTQSEDEETVQAKTGDTPGIGNSESEKRLTASKSGGIPMDAEILHEMEQKFGSRFSHVRIHTDRTASQLCREFNAKAFTHGSHIYFNEGHYDPGSAEGKRLLAHELTHVIQQTGRIDRQVIQRETNRPESDENVPVDGTQLPLSVGRVNTNDEDPADGKITFDEIPVPTFKMQAHRGELYGAKAPLIYHKSYKRGNPNQRDYWKKGIEKATIKNKLKEKIKTANHATNVDEGANHIVKADIKASSPPFYFGKLDDIATQLSTPIWGGTSAKPPIQFYDVDHIVELQLSNWTGSGWPNTFENMELLDSQINRASGREIKKTIDSKLNGFIKATKNRYGSSASSLKKKYHIVFERTTPGPSVGAVPAEKFWNKEQIEAGEQLNPVKAASLSDLGGNGTVMVFPNPFGGIGKQFLSGNDFGKGETNWFKSPFTIKSKQFNTNDAAENEDLLGHFMVNIKEGNKNWHPFKNGDEKVDVKRFKGAQYAGYIEKQSVLHMLRSLRVKNASPVAIDSLELLPDKGVVVSGRILTDIELIKNADIRFEISDGEFILFKTFDFSEINIPAPFEIKELSLTLFASTERGLGLEGRADFGIKQVGDGFIEAGASTSKGFDIKGEFNFDSKLFDPAKIGITYKKNIFGLKGQIGIPPGKLRGIKNALIDVSYSEGTLVARGDAELEIPGVKKGSMRVEYGEKGFSIGGTFELADNIPGIKSGSISAEVSKKAGEENYRLSANGTAIPDIPGIDSQLTVQYDDGAITIAGRAAYERDILSGEINIGASNRALDSEGQPTGDPGDNLVFYGGGSLTVQLTPWLKGTVGVQFTPKGEMIVSGTIGIPAPLEVIKKIEAPEYEIFSLGIDFPIFAIPVGPKSIGLKASIRGGLKSYAFIGPGMIEELELGLTYNPAKPEDTRVTGKGRFVIPAEAGLKLFVSASIGLDVLIGGVEGGIELGAGIGLKASASAGVNIDWSPGSGFELNALLEASVQPKFIFTIDGFIRAWVLWYEKEWRWRLADYEYGSSMKFGIKLPVHYKEGEPFDVSFDDIELITPKMNGLDFVKGLIDDIRNNKDEKGD